MPDENEDDWNPAVPRLYRDCSLEWLSEYLTREEFQRLLTVPVVRILPLADGATDKKERALGIGLSWLLTRDLMLVREISVRGQEDVPPVPRAELAPESADEKGTRTIAGRVRRHDENLLSAELTITGGGRPNVKMKVAPAKLRDFLLRCATELTKVLGGTVTDEVATGWRYGRPRTIETLVKTGELSALEPGDPHQSEEALKVWNSEKFPLVLAFMDTEVDSIPFFVDAVNWDPYDPQLHFQAYCAVNRGEGPQADALQFLRRALERAPAHGKAHMCFPHSAARGPWTLLHVELAYRLLPGNSFALANYHDHLVQAGKFGPLVVELAKKMLALDEENPFLHVQLINALDGMNAFDEALEAVRVLIELVKTPLKARTLACFKQDLELKSLIDSGIFDPGQWARAIEADVKQRKAEAQ